MDNSTNPSHGGARPGSGRPAREPSKVIRLPVSLVPTVQALLAAREFPAGTMLPYPGATTFKIPLFGHKVRAGFPSPADDYVEAFLDLNERSAEFKSDRLLGTVARPGRTQGL